jgi:hypothetical protein
MTPTLRRLGESERWLWFTWRGWLAVLVAIGILYGAVRVSPLGFRPTVTITLLTLTTLGMLLWGLSDQALAPERYLLAVIRYKRSAKTFACPQRPDRQGLVLDAIPDNRGDEQAGRPEQSLAILEGARG